jgi:hypothetical protein
MAEDFARGTPSLDDDFFREVAVAYRFALAGSMLRSRRCPPTARFLEARSLGGSLPRGARILATEYPGR